MALVVNGRRTLTLPEVDKVLGLSQPRRYQLQKIDSEFPRPLVVSGVEYWSEDEILAYAGYRERQRLLSIRNTANRVVMMLQKWQKLPPDDPVVADAQRTVDGIDRMLQETRPHQTG